MKSESLAVEPKKSTLLIKDETKKVGQKKEDCFKRIDEIRQLAKDQKRELTFEERREIKKLADRIGELETINMRFGNTSREPQ